MSIEKTRSRHILTGIPSGLGCHSYERKMITESAGPAGGPRPTLHQHLESKEAGIATVQSDGVERLVAVIRRSTTGMRGWLPRISAGLRAGLEFLAADPALARTLLNDPSSTPSARLLRRGAVARLAGALRPPPGDPGRWAMSAETARLLAEGIDYYLSERVLAGETEHLADSYDLLLVWVLTPPLPDTADGQRG
jgi:AcrR family transcriptional regulator